MASIGWHLSLKKNHKKTSFVLSFSLLNVSQLLKYIPGKILAYAIQAKIFSRYNVNVVSGIAANVLMIASVAFSSLLIFMFFSFFTKNNFNNYFSNFVFLISIFLYAFLVFGGSYSINFFIKVVNYFFKKKLSLISLTYKKALQVHAYYFLSNLLFGIAGYILALALGVLNSIHNMFFISSTILLSDTASYFIFLTPAGLGIREGIVFFMLKSILSFDISIALPVVFRILTMACDLILGVASIISLYHLKK